MVDNFVVPATLVSFVYVEVGCVEFEIRSPFQIARQCVYGVQEYGQIWQRKRSHLESYHRHI